MGARSGPPHPPRGDCTHAFDGHIAGPRVLRLVGLTKNFGANRVLKGVELDLFPGTVTALLGANGAGKSTLIKILVGVHAPSGGELRLSGAPVDFDSPMAAARAGVRTVYAPAHR